jgi:membrane-associated phospholipid phosphatase
MRKLVIDLKWYLIVSFLFISSLLLSVGFYGKKPLHLYFNHLNSPFQDIFFKYFTNFGDGWFAIGILIVLLFFINIRKIVIGLAAFLISGLVSQILKKVFFSDHLRPSKCFSPDQLHYVEGVALHSYNSFPSGHSTTAFAIFLFLAFVFKNKFYQVIFVIIACLTAYSRVYLSQHFFEDVAVGGIIGIGSFFLSYFIFNNLKINWFDKNIKTILRTTQK